MNIKIGLLRGDGIGPEIVDATHRLASEAAKKKGVDVDWVHYPIGWEAIKQHDIAVPESTKKGLETCDGWIMGPHDSAAYPGNLAKPRNPSGELRHHFDLYANIRPARNYPGLKSLVQADLIVVRENTEGFLADRNMYRGVGEFMPDENTALCVGVFTRKATERIAKVACELAMSRKKHLTIVHKANVIQTSFGFFRDLCKEVAACYPELKVDDFHIDAMTAHLVKRASDFDVIVTENLFGDILSDLTGELVGSLGLSPALNTNDTMGMAQAAHGSAPDIAGKGIANPVGLMLSTVMMFQWLGQKLNDQSISEIGDIMDTAILKSLAGDILTPDIRGGKAGTEEFTDAIIELL
ncbi:MAG: isocitrate/isopropylmalate dehydrogenase family protein [Bacteroidales bacterium]